MRPEDLTSFGIPPLLVRVWREAGISQLTPIQREALTNDDFNAGRNVLIVAPTSSGKTFIGEVAAAATALQGRRVAYLVPMKSIAEEKYLHFHAKYGRPDVGLDVLVSSGDHAEYDQEILAGNFNIAVVVYEKFMQLLVQSPSLARMCGLVVIDELQLIRDPHRGPRLEMLVTRLRLAPDPPRLLGLSATMARLNGLDTWLTATPIVSTERPVPLLEGICQLDGTVTYYSPDGSLLSTEQAPVSTPAKSTDDMLVSLAKGYAPSRQVLVFVSTREETRSFAERIASEMPVSPVEPRLLDDLDILEDTDFKAFLREPGLFRQVGYHNADLSPDERIFAETLFRGGTLRVLVSTTTLAMGVNLPSDLVIVHGIERWDRGTKQPIPVSEYKNAAGRAGRLGSSEEGRALLLSRSPFETERLLRSFITAQPEPIDSALYAEPDFGHHVLTLIATGLATNQDQVLEVFRSSFAYMLFYHRYSDELGTAVSDAVRTCLSFGLISQSNGALLPTPLGHLAARSGVSLPTFRILLAAIEEAGSQGYSPSSVLFHLLAAQEILSSPPYLRPDELDRDVFRPRLAALRSAPPGTVLERILNQSQPPSRDVDARLKKLSLSLQWVDGRRVRELERDFRIGHGAIRSLTETVAWLLETTSRAARVLRSPSELTSQARRLALRMRFGAPEELLPLAQLRAKGVGRDSLIRLVQNDKGVSITSTDALFDTSDADFRGVIGPRQLQSLREAAVATARDTARRHQRGHAMRLSRVSPSTELLERAYLSGGEHFDEALAALLQAPPLSFDAARVPRQRTGEADIHLRHPHGIIVLSVTAAEDPTGRIRWDKCREVLGQGIGQRPIQYVVIGKPDFHTIAIQNAEAMRVEGTRSLLLLPFHVLAELTVRVAEGSLAATDLLDLIRTRQGYLGMSAALDAIGTELE